MNIIPSPLRKDLEIIECIDADREVYTIKDPKTLMAFAFPSQALRVLKAADGQKTIQEIAGSLMSGEIKDGFPAERLAILFEKEASMGLLEGSKLPQGKSNPLLWKLVEFSADRFVDFISPVIGKLFGGARFAIFAIIITALICLILEFNVWGCMSQIFWNYGFWPETIVLILLAMAWHECGHLVAAKRYGGSGSRGGVGLFFLFPVAYVRVEGFRKIPEKKSRVIVALAGSYFDLISFSAALLVWEFSENFSEVNQIALVLSYMILTRICIDIIPFFRFDGYLALSEYVGRPKLREEACALLMLKLPFLGRYWKSKNPTDEAEGNPIKNNKNWWMPAYGFLSITVLLGAFMAIFIYWTNLFAELFPEAPIYVGLAVGLFVGISLLLIVYRDIARSLKI